MILSTIVPGRNGKPVPMAPKNGERSAKTAIRRIREANKINARAEEHNLAKVGVEGSNPFARSSFS